MVKRAYHTFLIMCTPLQTLDSDKSDITIFQPRIAFPHAHTHTALKLTLNTSPSRRMLSCIALHLSKTT